MEPTPTVTSNGHGASALPGLNLDDFRLPQNFTELVGVRRMLTRVPVRRPDRQWFVRTHPEPAFHFTTAIIEVKEDREHYLVRPQAMEACMNELQPTILHATMSRAGVLFLWPTRLPNRDGKDNLWYASAREAAVFAERHWASVRASTDLGGYEVFQAIADIPDPEWPNITMPELLALAFKDKIIDAIDHPVLLRLQGAV